MKSKPVKTRNRSPPKHNILWFRIYDQNHEGYLGVNREVFLSSDVLLPADTPRRAVPGWNSPANPSLKFLPHHHLHD